jgi:hypothetical protein
MESRIRPPLIFAEAKRCLCGAGTLSTASNAATLKRNGGNEGAGLGEGDAVEVFAAGDAAAI